MSKQYIINICKYGMTVVVKGNKATFSSKFLHNLFNNVLYVIKDFNLKANVTESNIPLHVCCFHFTSRINYFQFEYKHETPYLHWSGVTQLSRLYIYEVLYILSAFTTAFKIPGEAYHPIGFMEPFFNNCKHLCWIFR